jgi:hypothetical protein
VAGPESDRSAPVAGRQAGADGDRDVGLIREHAIEAEAEEPLELGGEVAAQPGEQRVLRVADPEVERQEAVVGAERPRVDEQVLGVCVGDQAGGREQLAGGVARDDEVLVDADAV